MIDLLSRSSGITMAVTPLDFTLAGRRNVRPVSQVVLELTDLAAFASGVALSVDWMNAPRRCNGRIDSSARLGAPFEVGTEQGSMPAAASIYRDKNSAIWAAKFDYPDASVSQRFWSTEISLLETAGRTIFMTRLSNVTLGADPPYSPSVPGLVKNVLDSLSVEADGFPMREVPQQIGQSDYSDFERLLIDKARRLPVLAIAKPLRGDQLVPSETVLSRLSGACHVVEIDEDAAWCLTKSLGKRFSVFDGAARLYLPGLDPKSDDPYRHPLHRPNEASGSAYAMWLARRILPQSFVRPLPGLERIRFASVKAEASAAARKSTSPSTDSSSWQAKVISLEQSLSDLKAQSEQDSQAAQALLDEAADHTDEVARERDELASENERLRAKLKAFTFKPINEHSSTPKLESYELFEAWADENLGSHIEILPRAIRETEKRGNDQVLGVIQDCLLLIRDFYVPMKIEGGLPRQDAFKKRCEEIGVEEKACFAQRGDIKAFPEYRIQRGGERIWLDRHFKYGGGTDLSSMFRIYFAWLDADQTAIIGHMPTHLDNNLTN